MEEALHTGGIPFCHNTYFLSDEIHNICANRKCTKQSDHSITTRHRIFNQSFQVTELPPVHNAAILY